jgi:hypothetical protein
MADQNETITVADLAAAFKLHPGSSKAEVLAAVGALRGGSRPPRKLSKVYRSLQHFEQLKAQPVRVKVTARHPICERGGVWYPAEFDRHGKVIKPADVFITDRARLLKISSMVEEVSDDTPTSEELAAKAKKEAAAKGQERPIETVPPGYRSRV